MEREVGLRACGHLGSDSRCGTASLGPQSLHIGTSVVWQEKRDFRKLNHTKKPLDRKLYSNNLILDEYHNPTYFRPPRHIFVHFFASCCLHFAYRALPRKMEIRMKAKMEYCNEIFQIPNIKDIPKQATHVGLCLHFLFSWQSCT